MKTKIYNWAKSFVINYERREKEAQKLLEETEKIKEEVYYQFSNIVKTFRDCYIDNKVAQFENSVKQKFSINDEVTFNLFNKGDSWNGAAESYLSHTPFKGPIDVIITGVRVDYGQLSEFINELHRNGKFDHLINTQKNNFKNFKYSIFKSIVEIHIDKYSKKYNQFFGITWAYTIKHKIDPKNYWKYAIAECIFVPSTSEKAVLSKQYFELETQYTRLENQQQEIRNRQVNIIKKLHEIKCY